LTAALDQEIKFIFQTSFPFLVTSETFWTIYFQSKTYKNEEMTRAVNVYPFKRLTD